jgi:hypothetical protein
MINKKSQEESTENELLSILDFILLKILGISRPKPTILTHNYREAGKTKNFRNVWKVRLTISSRWVRKTRWDGIWFVQWRCRWQVKFGRWWCCCWRFGPWYRMRWLLSWERRHFSLKSVVNNGIFKTHLKRRRRIHRKWTKRIIDTRVWWEVRPLCRRWWRHTWLARDHEWCYQNVILND